MKAFFPILALCGTANLFAASVAVPFSTNFDTNTAGTDVSALFVEGNSGTANSSFVDLGSGDIALRQTISGSGTSNTSASVSSAYSNFTAGGGFRISTTFSISEYTLGTGGVVNVSLSAFGTNTNLGSGNAYRLIYTLSGGSPGTLALQEVGGAVVLNASGNIAPIVSPPGNQVLTLTLEGIFTTPTSLSFVGTVTNGTSTLTLSGSDTSIGTANGDNFGMRSALNGNGATSSESITFTSFSLETIPEPTSALLLGLAGCAFGFRRRRA